MFKQLFSFFTSGATIELETVVDCDISKELDVHVSVFVKDHYLEAESLVLFFRLVEEVTTSGMVTGTDGGMTMETQHNLGFVYEKKIKIFGAKTLNANSLRKFDLSLSFPDDAIRNYTSDNVKIYWALQAELEESGVNSRSEMLVLNPK